MRARHPKLPFRPPNSPVKGPKSAKIRHEGIPELKGHSCGGVATLRHRLLLVRVEVGAENKAGGARVLRDVRNGKLFVGNAAGALL